MEAEIQLFDPNPTAKSIFVLRIPADHLQSLHERIGRMWRANFVASGYGTPPLLIVLPDDCTLESLTDEQLKSAGLLRIPDAAP